MWARDDDVMALFVTRVLDLCLMLRLYSIHAAYVLHAQDAISGAINKTTSKREADGNEYYEYDIESSVSLEDRCRLQETCILYS